MFKYDDPIFETFSSEKLLTSEEQEKKKKQLVDSIVKKFSGNVVYIPQDKLDDIIRSSFDYKNIPPQQAEDIINKVKIDLGLYNPEGIKLPPSEEPMIADVDVDDEEDMFEEVTDIINEIFLTRQNRQQKKRRKRMSKIAHKGTNWKTVKPKAGFKRVKIGRTYIRIRETSDERTMKKRIGTMLGNRKDLRKGN